MNLIELFSNLFKSKQKSEDFQAETKQDISKVLKELEKAYIYISELKRENAELKEKIVKKNAQ